MCSFLYWLGIKGSALASVIAQTAPLSGVELLLSDAMWSKYIKNLIPQMPVIFAIMAIGFALSRCSWYQYTEVI
jgi:Na+-driven multidrug efflux pump